MHLTVYTHIHVHTHTRTHTQIDTSSLYLYKSCLCASLLWTSMTGFPVMPVFLVYIPSTTLSLQGIHYPILPLDDLIPSSLLLYINMYGWSRGSPDTGRVCEKARFTWQLDWALVLFTLAYAGKDKSGTEVCSGLAHPQNVAPKATFSLLKTPALQASAAYSTSLLDFLLPQQIWHTSN